MNSCLFCKYLICLTIQKVEITLRADLTVLLRCTIFNHDPTAYLFTNDAYPKAKLIYDAAKVALTWIRFQRSRSSDFYWERKCKIYNQYYPRKHAQPSLLFKGKLIKWHHQDQRHKRESVQQVDTRK